MESFAFLNRNLLILFTCQLIFVSGTVLLVTVGGIAGHQLAPDPAWATLPVALMVVGTACATIPAALVMARWGRQRGFLLATVIASVGGVSASVALSEQHFVGFCVATTLIGSSLGFSQHFRFAAAESVAESHVSHAVSFILLGSIAGAILGPELAAWGATATGGFSSAFNVAVALYVVAALILLALRRVEIVEEAATQNSTDTRTLWVMLAVPAIVTAIAAGAIGQGVMTYVMTATPVSMNVGQGFSVAETSQVVRAHVIAMYLPSLITPLLITRFGLPAILGVGTLILAGTLVVGLMGHHYMHYWVTMVALGVGWNFLFVGGTTLLVNSYRAEERYRAQAANDFSVFGLSALASLLAGTVLHLWGWTLLLWSVVPSLFVMAILIFWWQSTISGRTNANA